MEEDENSTIFKIQHDQFKKVRKLQKCKAEKMQNVSLQEIENLINEMRQALSNISDENNLLKSRLLAMKETLAYEHSKFLINSGEETLAENMLIASLDNLKKNLEEPEIIFLGLKIINHYAYLLSKHGNFEKAREILEFSETTYENIKEKKSAIPFYLSRDLFSENSILLSSFESNNKLEQLVTNNLQMLAFIYSKLEFHDKFIEYHHKVLKRQIELKQDEPASLAIKSASLASYFLGKNGFKEARHHLAAANYLLNEHEEKLKISTIKEKKVLMDMQQKLIDVAKCWVVYGLTLFDVSRANIVSAYYNNSNQVLDALWISPFSSNNCNVCNTVPDTEPEIEVVKNGSDLLFNNLNLIKYEEQVTASLVETTADARALFSYIHSWIIKLKTYYTLHEHPMDYVNLNLNLNELYKHLAFYEEDIESQYSVHKLRADTLESLTTIIKKVHPECYINMFIEILRELAEVQSDMLNLNLRRIYLANKNGSACADTVLHKTEILTDVHSKLRTFGDNVERKDQ